MNNTVTRIIVGIIGIPIFLYLIITGGVPFFSLTVLIALAGLWEFHKIFVKKNIKTFLIPDMLFALLALYEFYFGNAQYIGIILLYPIIIFTAVLLRKNKNVFDPLVSIGGMAYIVLPLILLNELIKLKPAAGLMNYVVIIFILIWTCDTMSFFGGKLMGKHKLTEISPKKTIEGLINGIVFTIIAAFVLMFFNKDILNFKDALVIGLIVAFASPAGDIFESFLKRSADVKDSSHMIPGHGGVLDRFDSLLFVAPLVFVYIKFFR